MFPYTEKYAEFESFIQNKYLLYKIDHKCQNTFENLKTGNFRKIYKKMFYCFYKLHNSYFVTFVIFRFLYILYFYIYYIYT